ncbi:MAG: type III-A CRISPR-associated RAMP protein Csm3 [Desulfurobacteriaceae bacterium]
MKRLEDILFIEGKIRLETGLHIGAGNSEIKIGGIDNPVVRDPVTKEPYIPGSSVKGKIRMLLELRHGLFEEDGGVFSVETYKKMLEDSKREKEEIETAKNLLKLFGVSGADLGDSEGIKDIPPTRLSFYDLKLTEESSKKLKDRVGSLMTEDKVEVKINRISGTGEHPRHTERVPAGAEFEFKVALKIFDVDKEEELLELIREGLKLLEADSLGGNGSRGYGKIKFLSPEGKEGVLKVTSVLSKEEKEPLEL